MNTKKCPLCADNAVIIYTYTFPKFDGFRPAPSKLEEFQVIECSGCGLFYFQRVLKEWLNDGLGRAAPWLARLTEWRKTGSSLIPLLVLTTGPFTSDGQVPPGYAIISARD